MADDGGVAARGQRRRAQPAGGGLNGAIRLLGKDAACSTLGLAGTLPLLLDCLGWLGGRQTDVAVDIWTGISLKLAPGEPVQPALFWHGIDLFPPGAASERISVVARQIRASFPELGAIIARCVPVTYGMIGLSLDCDNCLTLLLGVAPG